MSLRSIVQSILSYRRPITNLSASITYLAPNESLLGKKIIVTGGGRGIGFSIAEKLMKEGAEVLIASRSEESLNKIASQIGCKYLTLDITKPDSFSQFIEDADKALGGLNGLVNNAGVSLHEKTFFDVTPHTFDIQINVNLRGGFFLTQEFIRHIKNRNERVSIVFISSETGDTMDFRPYGFTKASINSMVQGLAYLFNKEGIRINAVSPGITSSDMTGYGLDGNLFSNWYSTGRYYMPEEVAEVVSFLLSDVAGCISGQIITCNNAATINARWK